MPVSRRRFLSATAAAAVPLALPRLPRRAPSLRSGDRPRLGVIGVGNRGRGNLDGVAACADIAALCDVDARFLASAAERFPQARTFRDFRQLIDTGGIDAVVVSTPDHTHAPAAARALRAGLDVYCEKPLTHTVQEARLLQRLAGERGAVTQMGTQIHALANYRRVVEAIDAGRIGEVREVHVFCNGTDWSATRAPADGAACPEHLDWDLWLGPVAERPYSGGYHPVEWRRYWDFGGGTTADMACHFIDLAFWALDLRYPTTVQAHGPEPRADCAPDGLRIDYQFPARGTRPPVALSWDDGKRRPEIVEQVGVQAWRNGVLFVGSDGRALISDYTRHEVLPAEAAGDVPAPPPWIPDSLGHHAEWVQAITTRGRTTCPFDYSGPLTESVLLGVVSHRLGGAELRYDARTATVVGREDLRGLSMDTTYRDGFAP